MDAEPERNVTVRLARQIESVRIGKLCRIAVGCTDTHRDSRLRRQRDAANLDVPRRDSVTELIRAFEAQKFLDGDAHRLGTVARLYQETFLARPFGERIERVADQVRRRLVTGIQQKDALVQQLGFGQTLAVLFTLDESRQDVGIDITQMRATRVDQRFQVREHLGNGAVACFRSGRREHRLERAEGRERPAA